jgi:hypothetical protein
MLAGLTAVNATKVIIEANDVRRLFPIFLNMFSPPFLFFPLLSSTFFYYFLPSWNNWCFFRYNWRFFGYERRKGDGIMKLLKEVLPVKKK